MIYSEDNLLPISALEHLMFCERQCALIHIEQTWTENRLTVEGHHLHDKVHTGESEWRGEVRIARGLRLRSLRLGLTGVADVVEFWHSPKLDSEISDSRFKKRSEILNLNSEIPALRVIPVEYKRGIMRHEESFEVQLCAQALCLEEMLNYSITEGALFYGISKRRKDVRFDDVLRKKTEDAAMRLHDLIDASRTPPAQYEKKCERCSLLDVCMPKMAESRKSVAEYLKFQISDLR